MIFPEEITDCHTHVPRHGAIVNAEPGDTLRPDLFYSVGIHPWKAAEATPEDWAWVEAHAADPRVFAVGEAGLDALRGPSLAVQEEAFRRQVALSERVGKPLIIHVVRRIDDILRLHRELRPRQPWIVHGFRGGPEQARQLVSAGLYLSLGRRYNEKVPEAIPRDKILRETDEVKSEE